MSRPPPDYSLTLTEKKERNMIKLAAKYEGKNDLLAEWDLYPDVDPDYRNDLKRRVDRHRQDLIYRGYPSI